MSTPIPDFSQVLIKYQALGNGPRAEMQRCATPDELSNIPAFYRLSSARCTEQWRRVVYILAASKGRQGTLSLGRGLAAKDASPNKDDKLSAIAKRLVQVQRLDAPQDLIQLRRLIQHLEPDVAWQELATLMWYWGPKTKQRLVEDYFVGKYSAASAS